MNAAVAARVARPSAPALAALDSAGAAARPLLLHRQPRSLTMATSPDAMLPHRAPCVASRPPARYGWQVVRARWIGLLLAVALRKR